MFNFLFFLFLAGILIASIQDLRRREVDNIINFFLLIIGCSYVCLEAIFEKNLNLFAMLIVSLVLIYGFANLFYYGRIFAGGDAKLLIALTALFAASSLDIFTSLKLTLVNIGLFLGFLLMSGAFYGLFYSFFLFFRNFKSTNKEFISQIKKVYFYYFLVFSITILALAFFNGIFIMASILVLLIPVLYAFGKSIENVSLVKQIKIKDLREGDWILKNIKIGRSTIKSNWEGLTRDDLILLKKLSKNKKVSVKEGIPFVPAFLIAFLAYAFRDYIISFMFFT